MDHNTMKNMYKHIPPAEVERHKLGSVYFLLSGLATINTERSWMSPRGGGVNRRFKIITVKA